MIKNTQGRVMQNIPVVLVNTWLSIVANTCEENSDAQKVAMKNIRNVFGNIDVAQLYVELHKNNTAKFSRELTAEES